jgi:hypothetical protein
MREIARDMMTQVLPGRSRKCLKNTGFSVWHAACHDIIPSGLESVG